ncbi:MAG TPA: hypothetical protein VFW40_10990, partial [Capsulimonadaceae bacterium]|nr:hypothetical protein [Capsulimonadaceae bacterium]
PLSDVARALGGTVSPHGSGYEIVTGQGAPSSSDASRTAAGGANEVGGTNGNIGDWFFNGYWRFRVSKVERVSSYSYQYFPGGGVSSPDGPNDELVVVFCTIKNGEQNSDEPILTRNGLGTQKTALTDDQGQSYPPRDFDVRGGNLAPGAGKNFAVVFPVPKGTTLKDMIFTLYSFGASNKASNVRVSMAGQ